MSKRRSIDDLPPYDKIPEKWNNYCHACNTLGRETQRFGQWFFNTYDLDGTSFPELFYCDSVGAAYNIIFDNYYK